MNNLNSVYNSLYANNDNYNYRMPEKDWIVDLYALYLGNNKKIIDVGCGAGANLKRLLSYDLDVFGIEFSEICCKKYLTSLPHLNIDFVSYSNQGKTFDLLYMMDVLEHLPPAELEESLNSIVKISPTALFGIANHSDIQEGHELHLIQQGSDWWKEKLSKKFKHVTLLKKAGGYEAFSNADIYFVLYCTNMDDEQFLNFGKLFSIVGSSISQILCEKNNLLKQIDAISNTRGLKLIRNIRKLIPSKLIGR